MIKKVVIFFILVFLMIFSHYYNKHKILNYIKLSNELEDKFEVEKKINISLITINSNLSSRERIQDLAARKLGMFYPETTENIHKIRLNRKDKTFKLIDYFVPSAEALTE